jgi:Na+/phosphate symporter
MIIYLSLLVALIGVLMYALCVNPKLAEIGRLMFFAGLLAFLLLVNGPAVALLRR